MQLEDGGEDRFFEEKSGRSASVQDRLSLSKEDYEEFNRAPIRNSFNHITRRPTF